MMFDCTARDAVFEYLVAHGYTGNAEAYWDEMRKQSYWTEIRLFKELRITQLLEDYPTLKPFVDRVLPQAARHFESVRTDRGYGEPHIGFDGSKGRSRVVRPRPVRVEGVYFEFKERDNQCVVRVQTYVNSEFHRDKYFKFPAKKRKERK